MSVRDSIVAAGAALAVAFTATAAGAATLSSAEGDVLVNTGRGFQRGQAGQTLKPGDRVMVGQRGGNATINYDITCLERVTAGMVVTVRAGFPCEGAGALGGAAGAGGVGGISTGAIVLGGAAAIGGGVLIYNATKKSSSP